MSVPGPTGVLLVNLGTPDAPEASAVRRYLREFLSDPRVVTMNPIGRWLLLNLIILPRRPRRSAEAYRAIWTEDGSPLLVHGRALAAGVSHALGPEFAVSLAMRYGRPSLRDGLAELRAAGAERVVVLPLYPQYASSTTGSTLEAVFGIAAELWNVPALTVVPPFYGNPLFLDASAAVAREALDAARPDHVLFSFHGLPQNHLTRPDAEGPGCLRTSDCCDAVGPHNRWCYRAHCVATAHGLARALELPEAGWSLAFQSRLGRQPWIGPYTDQAITQLAERGVRRVAVVCPAFVADCLETLEEIGLRARDAFTAAGGEALVLVPSLNAHPRWVAAVAALVRRAAGHATSPVGLASP